MGNPKIKVNLLYENLSNVRSVVSAADSNEYLNPLNSYQYFTTKIRYKLKKKKSSTIDRKYGTKHKLIESAVATDDIILLRLVVAAFLKKLKI